MSVSTTRPTTRVSKQYRTRRGFESALERLSGSKSSALLHDLTTGESAFITDFGMVIRRVHARSQCQGQNDGHCVIHNPSDHVMRDFPLHWRWDRLIMERICPHGTGHPDPDDMWFQVNVLGDEHAGIHGCCGCCQEGGL